MKVLAFGVVAVGQDVGTDRVAQRRAIWATGRDRSVLGDPADRTVDRHPGHHLGVHEMPPRPANFPDALVGLRPARLEEVHQLALQRPGDVVDRIARAPDPACCELAADLARHVQGVHHLAVDVELELVDGRVADPYRSRALVAAEPGDLPLGQPALARRPRT